MRGVQAQLLLLALSIVLFAPALARGAAFGEPIGGAWAPVGVSVAIGAFLFGVGRRRLRVGHVVHRRRRQPAHAARAGRRLRRFVRRQSASRLVARPAVASARGARRCARLAARHRGATLPRRIARHAVAAAGPTGRRGRAARSQRSRGTALGPVAARSGIAAARLVRPGHSARRRSPVVDHLGLHAVGSQERRMAGLGSGDECVLVAGLAARRVDRKCAGRHHHR